MLLLIVTLVATAGTKLVAIVVISCCTCVAKAVIITTGSLS